MPRPNAPQKPRSQNSRAQTPPQKPAPRKPERQRLPAEERRAQILDTAREVFLRSGASGARVKELAHAAGVNAALLYQHFESKEELFQEAVLRPLAKAFEETATRFPNVGDAEPSGEIVREATETYLVHLLDAMEQTAALLGVALFDDAESGRAFFRQHLEPLLDHLSAVVAAHLPTWEHIEYDPDIAVMIVFGTAWYFAIEQRFGSGPPRDRRAVAAQINAIIFDGLRPR